MPRIASIAFGTDTAVMWPPVGSLPSSSRYCVWNRSGAGKRASTPNIASIAANLFDRSWVRPPNSRVDSIFAQNEYTVGMPAAVYARGLPQ